MKRSDTDAAVKLLFVMLLFALIGTYAASCGRDKYDPPKPPQAGSTPYPPCDSSKDDIDAIHRELSNKGIPKSESEFTAVTKSPGGVCVRSTTDVPPEALAAIDRGIQTQIEKAGAANPSWTRKTSLSQYRVLFVDPSTFHDPHPRSGEKCVNLESTPGAPCLLVDGGNQSAGTIAGGSQVSPIDRIYLVLPHQTAQGWKFLDYLQESARNESEHDRECSEEGLQGPTCLKFQGANDVHPHWP
jgi:hypothetical protein